MTPVKTRTFSKSCTKCMLQVLHTSRKLSLKLIANEAENRPKSKRKGECLPTIHFQVRAVSFREGISQIWLQKTQMIISVSLIILLLGSLIENAPPKTNTAGNTTMASPRKLVFGRGKFRTSTLFLGHPRFSHLSFQFMASFPIRNPAVVTDCLKCKWYCMDL